jgi:central kinetochore subunit Mal2/MCM21
VTAFRVQDPDPHAVDDGRVLGVRFDVVSTRTREFVPPYYVFLVRTQPTEEGEEDVWKVHKHTVPPAVPLGSLARRYIPVLEEQEQELGGDGDGVSGVEGKQDLDAFVRAVRRELVGMVKRKDALGMLEKEGKEARVIEEFRIVDGVGREVEMETDDGIVIRLMIDMSGENIEKVVVRSSKGRRRDVERTIMRDEARLNAVVQKLRSAL